MTVLAVRNIADPFALARDTREAYARQRDVNFKFVDRRLERVSSVVNYGDFVFELCKVRLGF
jgi:hypothetical protein